jgi:hypothetical protein
MTKQQALICNHAKQFVLSNPDNQEILSWAARSISALVRSARTRSQQQAILGFACFLNIDDHPDFKV